MTTATPASRAEKFRLLDIHDDTVEGVRILPGTKRKEGTKLEVKLFRHWEAKRRVLVFHGCENVRMNLDTRVLADNGPNNTCSAWASADASEIATLMRAHRRYWNVRYQKSIDPMPAKLTHADDLVLFRVRMFGGTLDVIARTFTLRRLDGTAAAEKIALSKRLTAEYEA